MSSKVTQGQLVSKGLRFAIVVARFNSFITERLLAGALDALARTGCAESDIEIVKVPGSWEMPVVARELAKSKRHDAIICRVTSVLRSEPLDVTLTDWRTAGLLKPSVARLDRIVTAEKTVFVRRLGVLSSSDLDAVRNTWNQQMRL